MKIEIIYEGPLSELSRSTSSTGCPHARVQDQDTGRAILRRDLFLFAGMSAIVLSDFPWLSAAQAQTQRDGLVEANVVAVSVSQPIIPAGSMQTTMGNIANRDTSVRRGLVVADFKTGGVQTDSGYTIISLKPSAFVTARIVGSVGRNSGNGATTVFTQLGSRSQSYRVR